MGFSDLISFFTILPVGSRTIQAAASSSHWLPVMGILVGVPSGLLGWLISIYAGPLAGAAAALAAACMLAGFHHVDGLADFADGLMARGSCERRIAAMRDKATGAGGACALVFCILLAASAMSQKAGADIFLLAILSEVAAKYAMVVSAAAGRAAAPGTGALFCESTGRRHLAAATTLWLVPGVACMWLYPDDMFGILIILSATSAGISSVILTILSGRALGGITGDVLGAIHETGRTTSLVVMVSV